MCSKTWVVHRIGYEQMMFTSVLLIIIMRLGKFLHMYSIISCALPPKIVTKLKPSISTHKLVKREL